MIKTTEQHINADPAHQQELLANGSRLDLIAWLCWMFPNGVWTDEKSARRQMLPITLDMARFAVEKAIAEGGKS